MATLVLGLLLPARASAAEPGGNEGPGAAQSWVDDVRRQTETTLGAYVRDGRSSFGTAVLVKDGQPRFEAAYGFEEPQLKPPFSNERTQIDLYSERKLFLAVAIAQLIDQRIIKSVDDPVNWYLKDFKLPQAFGREVTIRELATHSAGLDLQQFGAGDLESTPARFFSQRFPGYYENTGAFSTYDSYGPLLLIYMVSQLSGRSFPRYVEESIVRPLGLNHTYFGAPATPVLHRLVPFQPDSAGRVAPVPPLEPIDSALAGGTAVSTMHDIGRFMIALLGAGDAQSVITPSMRDIIFRVYQENGERGSAHGLLFDALRTGTATIYNHGAKSAGSNCLLSLDFSRNAGLFYCYGDVHDGRDRDPARFPPDYERVKAAMLKPFTRCSNDNGMICPEYPAPVAFNEAWNSYLGAYVSNARHHFGISRLRTLIHPDIIQVRRSGQSLEFNGTGNFVEIAAGTFGNPDVLATYSFLKDPETGQMIVSSSVSPTIYERPGPLGDPRLLSRTLAFLALVGMSGAILALRPGREIGAVARFAAAVYAAIVGGGLWALFGLHAFGDPYFAGTSWPLNTLRVLAFLAIPASVMLVLAVARAHPERGIRLFTTMHLYTVCASSILMVLLLFRIDLISFTHIT